MPLTILLVEDNEDAGESLAELLALQGHRIQLVANGRLGVAAAQKLMPDVLICDIHLPDMSGYDVVRELRESDALAGTFAIALTGYAQPEDQQNAVEAGFDCHLAKPPLKEELRQALARAMDKALSRRRAAPATSRR